LLGDVFDHPILLAPIAYHRMAHPEGELATVLGASALKAGMVLSTHASTLLEEVAAAAHTPLWFQLHLQPDRGFTRELLQRVAAAGYRAIVLTVDAPLKGLRNREYRASFALPSGVEAVNMRGVKSLTPVVARAGEPSVYFGPHLDAAPTWKDVAWLREQTDLPILIKGVLHPDDASLAIQHGAAGLIVSNHGGRTLDTLPATVEVLPAIVDRVAGEIPVLLDGGIRRGTDILKAVALGARAVLIGRPYIYGLATAGAVGVAHVINILRAELEMAMALTGRATLDQVDRTVLWEQRDR
jgi:4-hydroxymandelate oxidase